MVSALDNYQFGDLLGRGASGNVYRAINFVTGETVAIKTISVSSLPASSLPDIMSEIDLLKNLNHPNIVQYKGFERDKENLNIILEYCENGSLASILKRFGKFPESLVAVYMRQVLEGLVYLHEQGVIHRDIKGANILTNKDGSVKLADFGVSSRATPDLADVADTIGSDPDNEVVGSPYWMAPEVIEQSGATTASDVWSVGCVVVELLEGKPPYAELAPMQALWRIVQDESMRIPEGASPIVKDFLYQCFQKDANLRISAQKLLKHAWMQSTKKAREAGASSSERMSRRGDDVADVSGMPDPQSAENGAPRTEFAAAVKRVQEWNEALNAPQTATIRKVSAPPKKPDPYTAPTSHTTQTPAAPSAATGLLLKTQHVTDVLSRARESNDAEKWDDDFAFDSIPKLTPRKSVTQDEEHDQDQETVRPSKGSLTKARAHSSKPTLPGIEEDYSDLGDGADDLKLKISSMRKQNKGRVRLMHIDDLKKIGQLKPSPKTPRPAPLALVTPTSPTSPTTPSHAPISPDITMQKSPPGSRQSSLRGRTAASESNLELLKYSEAEDEDYSDMFDGAIISKDGGHALQSLQLTSRSNRSWKEEDDESTVDPFAELEDDFGTNSLEENLRRDKKATVLASIDRIIDQLVPTLHPATLQSLCTELLSLMETATPDMQVERYFSQSRGVLAVLEVLESKITRTLAYTLLKIVNIVVTADLDFLESFCLVGGIPVMMPYATKKHVLETRQEASIFIQQLTRSQLTLQMFISCRGLKHLVTLLSDDYNMDKDLVVAGLEGVASVFNLQSPTPKQDFCRMFTREGILGPLSASLFAIIKVKPIDEEVAKNAVDVLLLFCQVAQADAHVRNAFATRNVMTYIVRALNFLPLHLLVTATKAVKHLATSPQLIDVLQNSNAMETLVSLLGKTLPSRSQGNDKKTKSYANEICSHIFQTVYSLCRLSKSRQEEAAVAGIIPLLKRVIVTKSQLEQFALPVLCDLANASERARTQLWQNGGIQLYLGLLDDQYWRVSALDAITAMLQDQFGQVETELLKPDSIDALSNCFVHSDSQSYERFLDPYLKLLRLSPAISVAITSSTFLNRLVDTLQRQKKAMIALNLLRLVRLVLESHPDRNKLVPKYKFDRVLVKLAQQSDAVLVRELAKETYPVLTAGMAAPPLTTSVLSPPASSPVKRKASIVRKKSEAGVGVGVGIGIGNPPRQVSRIAVAVSNTSSHSSRNSSRSAPNATLISATAEAAKKNPKRIPSRTVLKDVQWESRSPLRPKHSGGNSSERMGVNGDRKESAR